MDIINYFEFKDPFRAWKGINIWLAQNEMNLKSRPGAGGMQGSVLYSYNNFLRIKTHKIPNEDWDIGGKLGYTKMKWISLMNNYLDLNYLDLIKAELESRHVKSQRNYNYSYHFKNKHGSGKDCLVSLNFSRRIGVNYPVVAFNIRTSEVTRRLIFDLILVQRIIEYVYPNEPQVELHVLAPSMFLDAESFALFNNTKSIEKIMAKVPEDKMGSFSRKVVSSFRKLMTTDPETINWKVHQRSATFIQEKNHRCVGLLIKDLQIKTPDYLPEDVITKQEAKKYRK